MGEYWKCPNTGRIIWSALGDNKARCNCGRTNPGLPNKNATEVFQGGMTLHFTFALDSATREEYERQRRTA